MTMPEDGGSRGGDVESLRRRIAELEAELAAVRKERDRWLGTAHLTLLDLADIVPPDRFRLVEPSGESILDIIAEFERDLGDDSDPPDPVPV